jgi:hypothetical protein
MACPAREAGNVTADEDQTAVGADGKITTPSPRVGKLRDPNSEPASHDPTTVSTLHESAYATGVVEAACPFHIDDCTLTIVGKRRKRKPREFASNLM